MFIVQLKEMSDSLLLQQLFSVFKYLFIGPLTSTQEYDLESIRKAKKLRICIYQTFFFFLMDLCRNSTFSPNTYAS